jgi:integrase
MSIKKTTAGWLVDIQPEGRGGKRFRKTFTNQNEAKKWEAWIKTVSTQSPDWQPEKRDKRKLSDLVDVWFTHHGSGLRAGVDMHRRLHAMVKNMGNPVADRFSVDLFASYRTKRIDAGVSPNNMNREHSYLRAMFNELIRLGHWTKENPISKLRQFKIQQSELSYLTKEQIRDLLQILKESSNPHVELISRICLSTGARWSEAENLRMNQVHDELIEFSQTKSGKNRAIPIDTELHQAIVKHAMGKTAFESIFGPSRWAFRTCVEKVGIQLPQGQLTHILRHSFASHFTMNGGNILTLQRILGHANVTMTMRYAHLSPDHLAEAKKLNPLTSLNFG